MMETSGVTLAMTSVTDALRNKKELLGTVFVCKNYSMTAVAGTIETAGKLFTC